MGTRGRTRRGTGQKTLLAAVLALIPMMAGEALGINLEATPSLRIEEGWNSNVFDTSSDEVSSFGTRVTPGLALKFTSPDNVTLGVSGNYEKTWYYDSDARDADPDTWFFRIDTSGGWHFTENLSMVPSVYYVDTTDSYRRTQLVPSGDPVIPQVSISNRGETNEKDFGAGIRFNYLVNPNVTVGVGGNYSEQRFSDSLPDSGLTDSKAYGGNASVSYHFTPRTTLGVLVAANHQTYEDAPDSDTLSGGLLFGYRFSEAFRLDGAFGMSYIRQSEAPGIPEEKESAPSGLLNIYYAFETVTLRVYGSAVYGGGSGFGEATRQWTAGLSLSGQLARSWSWGLTGAYQIERSVFVTDAVDINTTFGSGSLYYQAWNWARLNLTGTFDLQSSDGQSGNDLNSYAVTLGITIFRPYQVF
jgi:hypothetical protein